MATEQKYANVLFKEIACKQGAVRAVRFNGNKIKTKYSTWVLKIY